MPFIMQLAIKDARPSLSPKLRPLIVPMTTPSKVPIAKPSANPQQRLNTVPRTRLNHKAVKSIVSRSWLAANWMKAVRSKPWINN